MKAEGMQARNLFIVGSVLRHKAIWCSLHCDMFALQKRKYSKVAVGFREEIYSTRCPFGVFTKQYQCFRLKTEAMYKTELIILALELLQHKKLNMDAAASM